MFTKIKNSMFNFCIFIIVLVLLNFQTLTSYFTISGTSKLEFARSMVNDSQYYRGRCAQSRLCKGRGEVYRLFSFCKWLAAIQKKIPTIGLV